MITDSWRKVQKAFFSKENELEFEQDFRIFNFFADSQNKTIYGYGDIEYFSKKISFSHNSQNYDRALVVINHQIEINVFKQILKEIKKQLINADKIAICVNKFLLYSEKGDKSVNKNYDIALKDIILENYNNFSLDHYFTTDTKGDKFNFASPVTQFFLTR